MYERPSVPCPETFVKDGKPVFGTFRGVPRRLDIRGVRRPYSNMPLPPVITNLRIKSRLSFFFSVGRYIGSIDFFDAKLFGMAEVNLWNMATRQRYAFRSLLGPRRRLVPHRLDVAATSSHRKKRYVRISWDRTHDRLSVIFYLHGDGTRPSVSAAFLARFSADDAACLTAVKPAPILRRCSAHYHLALPLHGSLTLTPRHDPPLVMQDTDGSCFFDMNRTYMTFRSHGEFCTAMGTVDGKLLSFRLESGSQDAVDTDKYNGNELFYGGTVTALPPVVMTHPYGVENEWIIQDTEGMIDLAFTPISDNISVISVLILRTEYRTIYGTFEGVLLTAGGQKVAVRGVPGLIRKYAIRL